MDSQSSCTYQELVDDYGSTLDSSMWYTYSLTQSQLNSGLGIQSIPIVLHDQQQSNEMANPAVLDMSIIEEMVMEPLFWTSDELKNSMDEITNSSGKGMYVAASTYGIKNIVFSMPGCLLTLNESSMRFYIPQRLVKKISKDCKEKGIECSFSSSRTMATYYGVDVPQQFIRQCQDIFSVSSIRPVTPMLTPVHNDGYNLYCVVGLTICIVLEPGTKRRSILEDGSTLVKKEKRKICVVPLAVIDSTDLRNGVATHTVEQNGNYTTF